MTNNTMKTQSLMGCQGWQKSDKHFDQKNKHEKQFFYNSPALNSQIMFNADEILLFICSLVRPG